ncbi:HNH endonuclease [Kutzneria sp. CA-103260]|uniref:HNH endonuclease n=1 Tax=Kutzneria sp. CA-103260 TaxID=2802641 RepID=UPI001BAC3A15|nr:HNH endonuclease [Kutzneria sp. CA-103260]QUQ62422.1 HNH endonuclease [Kutzneria sp. CA-103260]
MGVLVLNASMEPLHTVSVPHAVRMLVRRVAEIHEADTGAKFGHYPLPRVVRLVRYVVMKWRYSRPPRWSRRGVLQRDHHRCAYCGRPADTVDHVLPLSRGGARTSWLNTVACCARCNAAKGSRLLDEAGLRLLVTPHAPSWFELQA